VTRSLLTFLLFPLGTVLLVAVPFAQEGTSFSAAVQAATPTATLSPMERLARPTLPADPVQADHGAEVFWLHCLPCHGERGQGLTAEFRETYPPEEQYCWEAGCHGKRPYEDGFRLPETIAAVIGPGTLQKFPTAASLRGYIFGAMPYWNPGSLTEQQSWQVTAFLLRENGLWPAREELNASNADRIRVGAPAPTSTPEPVPAAPLAGRALPVLAGGLLAICVILLMLFIRRHRGP
jgi:mono/diheme cytochrome c family protein